MLYGNDYSESILSAIASGINTRNDLHHRLGISYSTILRILKSLLENQSICTHFDNGCETFYLGLSERWRLNSFKYTHLIVDNYLHQFTIDDEPVYHFDDFDVYIKKSEFLIGDFAYIQTTADLDDILRLVCSQAYLSDFLPIGLFFEMHHVSPSLLKNFEVMTKYHFPIQFVNKNGNIINYFTPPQCTFHEFSNENTNRILDLLSTSQAFTSSQIASKLHLDKETVRKKLHYLSSKELVIKKQRGHCAELEWTKK